MRDNKLLSFVQNYALAKKTKAASLGGVILLLVIIAVALFYFVAADYSYYHKTIAQVTAITTTGGRGTNSGQDINQAITAKIMNGPYQGQQIQLQSTASASQAVQSILKLNDQVFVNLQVNSSKHIVSAQIIDLKRDKYIAYIVALFAGLILLIGGFKGFKSLASVLINMFIVVVVIRLYLHGLNLMIISAVASVLFIVISISLVSGINKKTISAIAGTLAATLISMLVTAAVILLLHGQGIHYEEMEFMTGPPESVFFAEILVGTLGAIMDIAISISSSIQELYAQNPAIEHKLLLKSGKAIGKDIMGTMANTLVFAYISGSIPMILLWLVNGFSIFYIVNVNISLEIIRALTGSIGIVLSIPITMYLAVLLLKRNWMGELKEI